MVCSVLGRQTMLAAIVGLVLASTGPVQAQAPEDADLASFFSIVGSELAEVGAFAIDPRSFASILSGELDWDVTPDDIEDWIGPEFRYGPIDRFVSCERDMPCEMAYPGTHIVLLRVAADDDREQVSLRLGRTGGADGAVFRGFQSVTVRRADGAWQVIEF